MAGYSVFVIYLFVDMIRFANVTTILSGSGKTKTLMTISIITLILNAFFNVVAYFFFGMIGPAITTLVLTFFMNVSLLHFGAKEIESTILHLFDIKEMIVVGAEILVLGCGAHYLADVLSNKGISLFFILAISFGTYCVMILLLNYRRIIDCLKKLNQYK